MISDLVYFNILLEKIDRACSSNMADIIITETENNKMKELILYYNFCQLVRKLTNSSANSSLLDLCLVRNPRNI